MCEFKRLSNWQLGFLHVKLQAFFSYRTILPLVGFSPALKSSILRAESAKDALARKANSPSEELMSLISM